MIFQLASVVSLSIFQMGLIFQLGSVFPARDFLIISLWEVRGREVRSLFGLLPSFSPWGRECPTVVRHYNWSPGLDRMERKLQEQESGEQQKLSGEQVPGPAEAKGALPQGNDAGLRVNILKVVRSLE